MPHLERLFNELMQTLHSLATVLERRMLRALEDLRCLVLPAILRQQQASSTLRSKAHSLPMMVLDTICTVLWDRQLPSNHTPHQSPPGYERPRCWRSRPRARHV